MAEKEFSDLTDLTDQELLDQVKKLKTISVTANALLIGVCFGVIIFSILKSTVGLFTLIPLFFAFKLINNSQKLKTIEELIKERSLK